MSSLDVQGIEIEDQSDGTISGNVTFTFCHSDGELELVISFQDATSLDGARNQAVRKVQTLAQELGQAATGALAFP